MEKLRAAWLPLGSHWEGNRQSLMQAGRPAAARQLPGGTDMQMPRADSLPAAQYPALDV